MTTGRRTWRPLRFLDGASSSPRALQVKSCSCPFRGRMQSLNFHLICALPCGAPDIVAAPNHHTQRTPFGQLPRSRPRATIWHDPFICKPIGATPLQLTNGEMEQAVLQAIAHPASFLSPMVHILKYY